VHVANAPDHTMLELLAEDRSLTKLSYKNASRQSNQLLNYLRKGGVKQGDTVFVMCGLHKELWLSYLSIMKGSFVMIPVASILSADDIVYRFEKARPKAIITDKENLEKIEQALQQYDTTIPVKLLLDKEQEGWQPISVIKNESTEAEAADTKASDTLFWFFTSG